MLSRTVSRRWWLGLVVLLAACSQPGPDFTLALRESSVGATPGGTATLTLTLTPQGGFAGNVGLTLERQDGSAPSGLTLSPTTLGVTGGGPVTQTLTLRVDGSVAPGSYPLRVRATSGSLAKTASFTLTVGAAPDFGLSLSPAGPRLRQGGSVALEATFTPQNGFSGTVNLALERQDGSPVPRGLTHTPTTATVNANPTRVLLTLNAATDLAPGVYRLRLRASQGSLSHTADFTLTVEASATVTLTVVDEEGRGYRAAYQVGTGVWQALAPSSTHTYSFSLGAETFYGVAVHCTLGARSTVYIIQADHGQLPNPRVVCSTASPHRVSYTVVVDVSSLMGGGPVVEGDEVGVSDWGGGGGTGVIPADGRVTVPMSLPAGSRDLLVTVWGHGDSFPKVAKALRLVDVRDGATDSWELKPSDIQLAYGVTVDHPAGYIGASYVGWLSRDNQGGGWISGGMGFSSQYRSVAGFEQGDRYLLMALASDGGGSNFLFGLKGSAAATDLSLGLPAPWSSAPIFTETAHPLVRGLSYNHGDLFGYYLELRGSSLTYGIIVSGHWVTRDGEYKVPDLSSLLGYTPFAPGERISTTVSALLSPNAPAPLQVLLIDFSDPALLRADTELYLAEVRGTYTVR